MTELHEAVNSGDLAQIRRILQRDPSCVNDWNFSCDTPLHIICDIDYDQPTTVKLSIMNTLVEYGADVNARSRRNGYTPFHRASVWDQHECMKFLLENGADPNLRLYNKNTVLHCVREVQHDFCVTKLLLQYGAEINAVNSEGHTPLDAAIISRDSHKVQVLKDAGAKAGAIFHLFLEATEDKEEIPMNFIIRHGAEIDLHGQCSIKALYFLGIKSLKVDQEFFEKVLLNQGVDVDRLRREGEENTDLHVAAKEADEARVLALLKAGADVNAKNVLYETPLHLLLNNIYYIHDDYLRTAKVLIESGADLYARNCLGSTPFQEAVRISHSSIVNLMLAKIAGVKESTLKGDVSKLEWQNKKSEFFRSLYPLAVAIALGYNEIVDKLIGMGHHIEAINNSNYETLLYYAIEERHYGIIKMLLEAGCCMNGRYPYTESLICLRCSNNNLEFICLLKEFSCFSALQQLIIDAMQQLIIDAMQHVSRQLRSNKLVLLLFFHFALGLRSNKPNKDLFLIKKAFYSNERISSILVSCAKKLDELKDNLVCNKLSKYDLLTMDLDSVVKILCNKDNFKACEELYSSFGDNTEIESHECMMKVRINLAMEKRKLLDSAKDHLNKALEDALGIVKLTSLPDEILYNIVGYLNVRELKKLST